jgi:NOL1/NOP2/fmu family ribosome biogenesis protein
MYFGTWMKDGLRLSIDGSQKIARITTKGTLELTREDWESWLKGQDIDTELPEAYYLVIYEGDCYGCAKASKGKLLNYVPKARRLSVINA